MARKPAEKWDEHKREEAVRDLLRRCDALNRREDRGSEGDKMVRYHIGRPLELYTFAAFVWNAKITGRVSFGEVVDHLDSVDHTLRNELAVKVGHLGYAVRSLAGPVGVIPEDDRSHPPAAGRA